MEALFSTAYWAPVSYFMRVRQYESLCIEQHERYQKQSYRNRCTILSANGPLHLTIPVLRPHDVSIREARIDYAKPWQQMHWRAIEAAYGASAYFDEFAGDVQALYLKETPFLFDLNLQSFEIAQSLLGERFSLRLSEDFAPVGREADFRFSIHPKEKNEPQGLVLFLYFQVFATKFGFTPNLSVLDLIFNQGSF